MNRPRTRGVSYIEFALSLMVLVPLLLGTGVIGVNMIRTLQTVQLARDAGHMYARGVDFSQLGNQTILVNLGSSLGLSATAGQGTAVVILSEMTYVDDNTCAAAGAATAGVHNANCTNFGYWVFEQRVELGNSAIRTSNYGSPITSGPNGVTVDPTTGMISMSDYVKKSGARATFSGVNPYSNVNGTVQGLPSGQSLYLAEAGSTGFNMPPFVSNAVAYSFGFF
ncbi:MAG TPA: hypothetical protein VLY24_10950 [Bryobacteraceae bacterium]|nr:hypothetical protein [Bryobacteraceae bacterium]